MTDSDEPDPSRAPRSARRRAAPKPSGPRLEVTISDVRGRPVRAPSLAAWLSGLAPRSVRGTVTIVLASDASVRRLNRQWRRVDRPTDVLSFPSDEPLARQPSNSSHERHLRQQAPARRPSASAKARSRADSGLATSSGPPHLGDIVIATGVAARQAREAGHSLRQELRVLALHGFLHLLGYDHDRDAGEMARIERRLRRAGGLASGLIERAPRPARRRS